MESDQKMLGIFTELILDIISIIKRVRIGDKGMLIWKAVQIRQRLKSYLEYKRTVPSQGND